MNLSEIRISEEALLGNVAKLRSLIAPGPSVIAVVKGNAYGHGLSQVVAVLENLVDGFQVDDMEELRSLRSITDKRILVLGYVPPSCLEEAIGLGAELCVYDESRIRRLGELGRAMDLRPKVHLKVDTLLGRLGVLPPDIALIGKAIIESDLELVAAYTHFANIEDTTDLTHAHAQVELFDTAVQHLRAMGLGNFGTHLSATSGVMISSDSEASKSLVRLGIGLYGLYPSPALARRHETLALQPALSWVSHLAQVKLLPPGHPVGYGLTYVTWRETPIGIVPQGYSDGVDRGLSSVGEVLVRGRRCPIVGRVAMNMFAIDLSRAPDAEAGDEVVLLGAQGQDRITAEDIAARLGTINYEVVARISPLLPRA